MATSIRATLAVEMVMDTTTESWTATRPFDIIDIVLQSIAGAMGNTVAITNAGTTINSTGLACADALGTIARVAQVAPAARTVASGAALVATGAGSARGRIYFIIEPNAV